MNSLSNLNKVFIPNTLDGINIISDEVSTNALLVDGSNFMLADLNMNNYIIKNLDAGIVGSDAVNLTQLQNVSTSSTLYASSVSSASRIFSNNVSSSSFIFATTQSALKVSKAGDTMSGALSVNYTNAILEVRANNETEDATLFLTTPYQNGSGRRKTSIIADGIGSWNRANLHFCLNQAATHDSVTISDSKMCILNSSGNVGIATTTPSQKLDVNGNCIVRGSLDMNTTNKIINVANGTSNNDVINLSQLNAVSSSSSISAAAVSSSSFIFATTQSSLKVDKAGDTMTGYLQTPEIRLTSQTTTYNSGTIDSSNRTNTYAVFDSAGSSVNWAFLRQIGNYGDIHLSLDFHDTLGTGNFSLRNVPSINNPDSAPKSFFYSSPTLTSIKGLLDIEDNNAQQLLLKSNLGTGTIEDTGIKFNHSTKDVGFIKMQTVDSSRQNGAMSFDVINNNVLQNRFYVGYDKVKCSDYFEAPEIRLTSQTTTYNSGSIDSSNRTNTYAVFEAGGATSDWAFLRQIGGSNDIHLSFDFHDDDNDGKFSLRNIVSTANPDTIKPFFTSTPGGTSIFNPNSATNIQKQLNLETNSNGIWFNPYFSAGAWNPLVSNGNKGIIFSNGATNTGDLVIAPWSNSSHGIKIIGSNGNVGIATATPSEKLDVNGNIKLSGTITRSAWSSGELIQTKIYNQNNSGSGLLDITGGNGNSNIALWKEITFTMLNTTTDSDVYVEVSAPFHLTGSAQDVIYSQLRDFTSSTEQEFGFSSAYYGDNSGGGYRSGSFLPYSASYTPTSNTGNKTRTIQIRFNNLSNDTLSICKYKDPYNNLTNKDLWTVRISEYKK